MTEKLYRLLECQRCGLLIDPEHCPANDDRWYCPRCKIDESGLEMIDLVLSPDHNDSMIDRETYQLISTDPDFRELVEELAEQLRVQIMGDDDGTSDRIMEMTVDLFSPLDLDASDDLDKLAECEDKMYSVLHQELKVLVDRIFDTGDWNTPQGAWLTPAENLAHVRRIKAELAKKG